MVLTINARLPLTRGPPDLSYRYRIAGVVRPSFVSILWASYLRLEVPQIRLTSHCTYHPVSSVSGTQCQVVSKRLAEQVLLSDPSYQLAGDEVTHSSSDSKYTHFPIIPCSLPTMSCENMRTCYGIPIILVI